MATRLVISFTLLLLVSVSIPLIRWIRTRRRAQYRQHQMESGLRNYINAERNEWTEAVGR
jgi:hypothetical protein